MADAHEIDRGLYEEIYDEVKKGVVATRPSLPRREQSLLIKDIFRSRHYVPDMQSVEKEHSGEEEYDGAEFELRDGEVYFTRSGRTLNELHERARLLKPQVYDEQAHKTDLLVQSALVSGKGSNEVSHVSFFRDGQGREQIRDVVTFHWDGKKGKQVVNNIAPDGKFFTVEGAREKMRSMFGKGGEIGVEPGVFVFAKKTVDAPTVKPMVEQGVIQIKDTRVDRAPAVGIPADISSVERPLAGDLPKRKPDVLETLSRETHGIASRVAIDTAQAVKKAGVFVIEKLRKKISKKQSEPQVSLANRIGGIVFKNREEKDKVIKKAAEYLKPIEVIKNINRLSRKTARLIAEKYKSLVGVKTTIAFAVSSGVAIGVALYGLRVLAHEQPVRLHKKKEKNRTRTAGTPLEPGKRRREWKYGLRKIRHESKSPRLQERQTKESGVHYTNKEIKSALAKKSELKKPEVHLWKILKKLASHIERPHRKPKTWHRREKFTIERQRTFLFRHETIKQKQSNRFEHAMRDEFIVRLSFAIVLWMLLKHFQRRESITPLSRQPESLLRRIEASRLIHEPSEALIQREPSQWLMLSIIWYLAMIREAGISQINQYTNTTNKQMKKKHKNKFKQINFGDRFMPTGGIIFAFSS